MSVRYAVVIEKTDNGYSAYAPDLPGVSRRGTRVPKPKG